MPARLEEIKHYQDRESEVVQDRRFYPLILSDTTGIFTEGGVNFYFIQRNEVAEYAASRGEKIITILNVPNTLKPPPATVRKLAGEYAAKDASTPGLMETNIVVNNPLLRGVITAIVWIAGGENTTVKYSPSLEQAIRMSLRTFEGQGITVPTIDPATYKFPSKPA